MSPNPHTRHPESPSATSITPLLRRRSGAAGQHQKARADPCKNACCHLDENGRWPAGGGDRDARWRQAGDVESPISSHSDRPRRVSSVLNLPPTPGRSRPFMYPAAATFAERKTRLRSTVLVPPKRDCLLQTCRSAALLGLRLSAGAGAPDHGETAPARVVFVCRRGIPACRRPSLHSFATDAARRPLRSRTCRHFLPVCPSNFRSQK